MADYLVTDTELSATADVIRAKTGSSSPIEWEEGAGFADAVEAIETGGGGSAQSWTTTGRGDDDEVPLPSWLTWGDIASSLCTVTLTYALNDGRTAWLRGTSTACVYDRDNDFSGMLTLYSIDGLTAEIGEATPEDEISEELVPAIYVYLPYDAPDNSDWVLHIIKNAAASEVMIESEDLISSDPVLCGFRADSVNRSYLVVTGEAGETITLPFASTDGESSTYSGGGYDITLATSANDGRIGSVDLYSIIGDSAIDIAEIHLVYPCQPY